MPDQPPLRRGNALRRAALVALAALALTVGLFGPGPVPAAAEPGPPVFGPVATTTALGGPQTPLTELSCPDDHVLTGLSVQLKGTAYAGSAGPLCSRLLIGEAGVYLGGQSAPDPDLFLGTPDGIGGAGVSQCPADQVVVGFDGVDAFGGFVDALAVSCRQLDPDGRLTGPTTVQTRVGKVSGPVQGPFGCDGENAVATGIAGAYDPDLTEEDLYNFSLRCQQVGFPGTDPTQVNLAWPTALPVTPNGVATPGAITATGQDRWYRFPVQPGSRVTVDLGGLPADYDLTLFGDIGATFERSTVTSTADLTELSAEFAGDAFAPSVFSPSVFSPSVFSPSVFSPSVFSPSVFSPSVFSPSVFSPSVFSPSVFSPSVFSPSVFSPSVFSPAVSLPSVFSPSVFSPSVFSPSVFSDATFQQAFASAQTRTLLGVSAHDGTAAESISADTQNTAGSFYVRVQARNGVFAAGEYDLAVTASGGGCSAILNDGGDNTLVGTPGTAQTVIITDPARLPGTAAEKAALATRLQTFAGRVGGVVVDLGSSPKIVDLNAQADAAANRGCPYAKNLVAQAIRDVVNSYRDQAGTLRYVVIIGADQVVPFFRYPDAAGLGPESNYAPPVASDTASDASLRGNYVLGQDAYGSALDLDLKGTQLPVPDLAVGRLVESPTDIAATLGGYLDRNGAAIAPTSTLATGYDFLTDAADSVAADLAAGTPGGRHDTLITDADVPPGTTTAGGSPSRRTSWTAGDLRSSLLGSRHDLVFLAGHFSANNTLAADYKSTLDSREIAAAPAGTFANSLIFSAGCHSGYTIVDGDGIPSVTDGLDWTEAFAKQGATLVAGTGYQYGDTDFLAYSEKLYAGFARQLRIGTGAVPIGSALVKAKQDYLEKSVTLAGIDQKSVLQATLYGLPMQGVNLPGGRLPAPTDSSVVTPTAVGSGPGSVLGLQSDDLQTSPALQPVSRTLTNLDGGTVTASYLTGPAGVATRPAAPALPLVSTNVTAPGRVLRGVALRSATYADTDGITPLTGAPATETQNVHGPFVSTAFYPARLAVPNYLDALDTSGAGGTTRLQITPTQYRSDGAATLTTTQRRYASLGMRLYYSANVATYGTNQPALAAPPSISGVTSSVDGSTVRFAASVVGDPSAGIQSVFVTYTGERGGALHGRWASVDLTQDATQSTRWTGTLTLPAGQSAAGVRFQVQAVNGVGLVTTDDNQGGYYVPAVPVGGPGTALSATALALGSTPGSAAYGSSVPVSATLTAGGSPLAQRRVTFALGGVSRTVVTDAAGVARTTLPLSIVPGSYRLTAGYDGDATTRSGSAPSAAFLITKQPTSLSSTTSATGVTATLTGAGSLPLRERTVYFAFRNAAGQVIGGQTVSTDLDGSATVPTAEVPAGSASAAVSFGSSAAPVPNGAAVDLSDVSYASANAAVTLAATVAAQPDAYTTVETAQLKVTAPGVLGNDASGTTARLVTGPTTGTLALKTDGSLTYTPVRDFVGTVTFTYQAVRGTTTSAATTVTITVTEAVARGCTITGTAGDDVLTGTPGNDVICGLGGNDTINGGGGNDILIGGPGQDAINGGAGTDALSGGTGNDTLRGDDGVDALDGRSGDDVLFGGAGVDALLGGSGDDQLSGDAATDVLAGENGNDTLRGGAGDDGLTGGPGVDALYGEDGNDLLDVKDGSAGDLADGGPGTKDVARTDSGDTTRNVP